MSPPKSQEKTVGESSCAPVTGSRKGTGGTVVSE